MAKHIIETVREEIPVAELLNDGDSTMVADYMTTCRGGCGLDYLPTKTVESVNAFAKAHPEGLTCDPCRHKNRVQGATPCLACQRGLCSICHGTPKQVSCTCDHG